MEILPTGNSEYLKFTWVQGENKRVHGRGVCLLLTRTTLHLWLNTFLNHEELDGGRISGYVSQYPCSTPILIYRLSSNAGSGEQAQHQGGMPSTCRIELKTENTSSLG